MFRLISLLIGYVLGNILTAEIVARRAAKKSAFEIGTGNPGMANIMAQCGFTAGIAVLAGDLAKTILACALCRYVLFPEVGILACAYAGLGACLGHCFPCWHKFKGGKAVTTTCAVLFMIHPLWGLCAMIVGMLLVFASRYLPVGAVFIPAVFIPMVWLLYGSRELCVVVLALTVLMFIRHFPGLKNILSGKEPAIDVTGLLNKKFGRLTVYVILAAAVAVFLLAAHPWYVNYIKQDHIVTCDKARMIMVYGMWSAEDKVEGDGRGNRILTEAEALDAVNEVLSSNYGVTISAFGEPLSGLCREGGTWTILFDEETGILSTFCTAQDHEGNCG